MERSKLKVIIVGGSIAGLTLAHCLEAANIDYIVLEKHQEILTTLGGPIGMWPNGLRILDQLGLYEGLEKMGCPVKVCHTTHPDGFAFSDDFPARLEERFGYPLMIVTRQQLLDALYSTLRNPEKVKTGQRVVDIQTRADGVSVFTDSEGEFTGDVVVGADGVRSVTRSHMWRAANLSHPNLVTEKETRTMCAEYSCAVGISFPVKGLECPDQVMCCHDDQAVLLFPGKDGSIRWVLIQKLRKRYVYPETHRFSKDEVHAMCQAAADIPVYRGIKFKDIWTRTTEYGSALLQEGLLQIWTHGRTVCIGDSVSKITPNIAQGANTTIESAAALANVLRQVRDLQQPSEQTIGRLLQGYAEKHRKRLQGVHALSYRATRLCAWSGVRWKLMARYVWPNVPGGLYHAFVKIIAPGPVLDFIPLPSRCMQEGVMLSGLSTMRFGWVVLMIIAGVAAMSFSLV